eukprot:325189-Rhodomonas_salina.2
MAFASHARAYSLQNTLREQDSVRSGHGGVEHAVCPHRAWTLDRSRATTRLVPDTLLQSRALHNEREGRKHHAPVVREQDALSWRPDKHPRQHLRTPPWALASEGAACTDVSRSVSASPAASNDRSPPLLPACLTCPWRERSVNTADPNARKRKQVSPLSPYKPARRQHSATQTRTAARRSPRTSRVLGSDLTGLRAGSLGSGFWGLWRDREGGADLIDQNVVNAELKLADATARTLGVVPQLDQPPHPTRHQHHEREIE